MADLRQACDRCHDKKLRCLKVPGHPASCTRCLKAGVPCAFSPPTKPSGPAFRREQWASIQNPEGLQAADVTPHWTELVDFGQAETTYDAFSQAPFAVPDPMDEVPDATAVPSTTQTRPALQPVQNGTGASSSSEARIQLAAMINGLESTNQRLAALGNFHVSKDHIQEWAEEFRKTIDLSNTLESLLTHTQNLSALYTTVSELSSSASHPRHQDDCRIPNCIHEYMQVQSGASSLIRDYTLINLLFACHLKLLDSLDTILGHAHTCSHAIITIPKAQEPQFDIPEIRIGSFVAPRGAAASLFTTMLFQLLVDLQDKNRGLARSFNANSLGNGASASREIQVLSLQSDIIGDRTTGAAEDMRKVKTKMVDMGIIK